MHGKQTCCLQAKFRWKYSFHKLHLNPEDLIGLARPSPLFPTALPDLIEPFLVPAWALAHGSLCPWSSEQ